MTMMEMNAMMIIVAGLVFASVMVLGFLIGMSVHREATRRRRSRLHHQEMELALERGLPEGLRRFRQRFV